MFRKYLIASVFALATILTIVLISKSSGTGENIITVEAQKGPFESLVYSSGQLQSVEADNIPVPEVFRDGRLQIYSITIADLIDEGTYVDSGDYVATIDHSAIDEQQKSAIDQLKVALTEFEDSKIDSNLTLSNQRDLIVNARLDLEEKELIVQESVYESPSVKRKAELDLKKAQRKLEQVKQEYVLKQEQETNKVARKFISYKQTKERVELIENVYDALTITAPRPGIIGYYKYSGGGGAIKATSSISTRSPAIATFPKMNSLLSVTYINEIDISKIKPGQKVAIGIDAFPEKVMEGEVTSIANVGQVLPRSDAKVFEVKITVNGSDPDVKPSMTTSNIIQTGYEENALSIPLESVFSNDSLQYVFIKGKKLVKQIIEPGIENENFLVVKQGVQQGDILCLSEPENAESLPFTGMEIFEQMQKQAEVDNSETLENNEQETDKVNSPN